MRFGSECVAKYQKLCTGVGHDALQDACALANLEACARSGSGFLCMVPGGVMDAK